MREHTRKYWDILGKTRGNTKGTYDDILRKIVGNAEEHIRKYGETLGHTRAAPKDLTI